jgi:cation diffusion facilitator CzcD-associated flavoprotein CzcO
MSEHQVAIVGAGTSGVAAAVALAGGSPSSVDIVNTGS